MNMFQLQERIKDFSKDQLINEMQQPSGSVPPFLVLTELQRRTRMEQAFQADQAQADQTTVAQDAVNAAGVPQGGIADIAQAMAPQTDMGMNTGAAPMQTAPAEQPMMPVQGMYDGGVVRMQPGGLAGVSRDLGAYSPTMGGARPPQNPRLVVRNGIQYAEMPDGSLIALGELGFGAADQAGAGTADLTAPMGFPSPDTGPLPTQMDFDQRFMERELGITGAPRTLDTPALSEGVDLLGADVTMDAPRTASALGAPDRETSPRADILRPPSIDYLQLMGDLPRTTPAGSSAPSDEALAAIAGVPSAVLAPVQGPNVPPSAPPSDPSGLGLPEFMFSQRGTVPEPQPGEGIMPSDIGRAIGEGIGLGPAMDVARATRTQRDVTPLPMDTGTPLTVPPEGIESLLPPPAPTTPPTPPTGGGAGGSRGALAADRMLEQDKWLALAQFGLGLMASQAPTLGGAIGEAGTAALGQFGKARQAAVARDLEERKLQAAMARGGARGPSFGNLISLANARINSANSVLEGLSMAGVTSLETALAKGQGDAYRQAVRDLQEGNELLRSIGPAMGATGSLSDVNYNLTE
jgi:hypothetical protein